MNTLERLLAGIVADPLEETRWLVLADWLEEFDDPRRAELLRLHRKMLAGVDRGGWSVEGGGTDPVFSHHSPHSTRHDLQARIVEGGGTDPVFSHHSPHSTRHDLQARIVALIAEGVRPCVPQETLTLPGGGWRVKGGGTNPSSPATRHPPPSTLGMTFSFIPPGSFLMGSNHTEGPHEEKPVHRVTLTKGFFLGIHPVTQAQWNAITRRGPSNFKGSNRPVANVSWEDCQQFCDKLTARLKRQGTIRLPSEAEWEYACRAGTTTKFHFGDVITTDLANYNGRYGWNGSPEGKYREETTEVGSFPANPWGLFDMHGNVYEWCQDWYADYTADDQIDTVQLGQQYDECRVLRGGAWTSGPIGCHSACRHWDSPWQRNGIYGFRCVLGLA